MVFSVTAHSTSWEVILFICHSWSDELLYVALKGETVILQIQEEQINICCFDICNLGYTFCCGHAILKS